MRHVPFSELGRELLEWGIQTEDTTELIHRGTSEDRCLWVLCHIAKFQEEAVERTLNPITRTPLETHTLWIQQHRDVEKDNARELQNQMARIGKFVDWSRLSFLPDGCSVSLTGESSGPFRYMGRAYYYRTLSDDRRRIKILKSIKKPTDLINIKGIGKVTLNKLTKKEVVQ